MSRYRFEKFITYPLSTTACQDQSCPSPAASTSHRCNFIRRQGDLSRLIFHINHLSHSINSIECPWQSHLSSNVWEREKQTDRHRFTHDGRSQSRLVRFWQSFTLPFSDHCRKITVDPWQLTVNAKDVILKCGCSAGGGLLCISKALFKQRLWIVSAKKAHLYGAFVRSQWIRQRRLKAALMRHFIQHASVTEQE